MDDDEPPGVPEWVVTYGDMMSLLLTFFIMLVSLSEVVADQKYRAIMEALHARAGYQSGPLAPPGKNFPMNSISESLISKKLGSVSDDEKGKGGVKQKGTEGSNLRVTRLREGQSQLAGDAILFANGSPNLVPEAIKSIKETAREIAGKPHKLEIRAFTNRYIAGQSQTHTQRMDLAYERASKVMQLMLDLGLKQNRMRIVVYFHNPNVGKEREKVLAQDRVEITTLDEYASTYVGQEEDY